MQKIELFKPDDFFKITSWGDRVANRANEKLQEYLESCPVVYGAKQDFCDGWGFDQQGIIKGVTTHTARLAFIEELAKDPCKHEPTFVNDGDTTNWKFACKRCGVKLEAEWKEVK